MSLLFGLISKFEVVLCKHANRIGNFDDTCAAVLEKIVKQLEQDYGGEKYLLKSKMTFASGTHSFHYVSDGAGFIFLAVADDDFDRSLAFKFIDQIKTSFEPFRLRATQSGLQPLAFDAELSPKIRALMDATNEKFDEMKTAAEPDKVDKIKAEVAQVKDQMAANIDSIVERGERLDLLVDRSEQLNSESVTFRRTTTSVRRRMWWQNMKMKIVIAVVLVVLAYAALSLGCGGLALPKCV